MNTVILLSIKHSLLGLRDIASLDGKDLKLLEELYPLIDIILS